MDEWRLIRKSLIYFRAEGLAVAAGVAVATAVLTGALMVGDSMTDSLRALVVERLGPVDHVVVSERFFEAALVQRLVAQSDAAAGVRACTAAILARGTATDADEQARARRVNIFGIDPASDLFHLEGLRSGTVIVNGALADDLGTSVGQTVLLRLPTSADIPRSAPLGRRDQVANTMRLTVAAIVREPGPLALFTIDGSQRVPRNAWVTLADAQNAVERPGRANALLVAAGTHRLKTTGGTPMSAEHLAGYLRRVMTLDDYELTLRRDEQAGVASLETRRLFLSETTEAAARSAAEGLGIAPERSLVYLVNTIRREPQERVSGSRSRMSATDDEESGSPTPDARHPMPDSEVPYSIVAGLHPPPGGPLGPDEIVLNRWLADDLQAETGDRVRLIYAERAATGEMVEVGAEGTATVFTVRRIIPLEGQGADPSLTPPFKGVTDALTMTSWKPPTDFNFRLERIGPRDEAYWERYRAAPKAFVALETARRLWPQPLGRLTSFRVPIAQAEAFEAHLRGALAPHAMGVIVRPIRAEQLASASGSTDFGHLFVGFSFFLIVSAALLVGLLFRLTMERRASQTGLMLAVGFTGRLVRRIHLAGGMILAAGGALVGLAGAIGYAALMLAGLRTWWIDAVGSSFAELHVRPVTLLMGYGASLLIAYVAIRWAVRRTGRTPATALLAGASVEPQRAQRRTEDAPRLIRGLCRYAAVAALGGAGVLLVLGASGAIGAAAGFFASGVLLLTSALAGLVVYLKRGSRRRIRTRGAMALERLGVRNAGRHVTRSALTAGLIAAAAFVIVTVAAMRRGAPADTLERHSGAGGFNLIAEADVPLPYSPATAAGRKQLLKSDDGRERSVSPPVRSVKTSSGRAAREPGTNPAGQVRPGHTPDGTPGMLSPDLWQTVEAVALRASDGQDISCLNLFRPTRPRILGVPPAMIDRGGFTFSKAEADVPNPWVLLRRGEAGDEIPVIADAETAQWILHLGLGDVITITDEAGRDRRLRLTALLAGSIFQGELLMSEVDFVRLFPGRTGFNTVLIRTRSQDESAVKRALETGLADFGLGVDRTADRLALFQAVAGTYLAAFQTLGGLGLLLGTIGLGVVLLRGLIERRGELALLSALGFRRRAVMRLVLAENGFLLVAGVGSGVAAALVAVLPQVAGMLSQANWPGLAATLAGIVVVGLAALALAVRAGLRTISAADLRAE